MEPKEGIAEWRRQGPDGRDEAHAPRTARLSGRSYGFQERGKTEETGITRLLINRTRRLSLVFGAT